MAQGCGDCSSAILAQNSIVGGFGLDVLRVQGFLGGLSFGFDCLRLRLYGDLAPSFGLMAPSAEGFGVGVWG